MKGNMIFKGLKWNVTEKDARMGFPEMGSVRLSELAAAIGPGGLRIERDLHFRPTKTLRGYAEAAHREQHISD